MWRRALFLVSLAVTAGCFESLPTHNEIIKFDSRAELSNVFGEPFRIDAYQYLPDVMSIREQLSGIDLASKFERWTYLSMNPTDVETPIEPGESVVEF